MKFAAKLTILLLGITTVITVIVSYSVYTSSLKIFGEEVKGRLEDQAFHTMDKIDRTLYERFTDIRVFASDAIISSRESTPEEITERLITYRNTCKTYSSLYFADLNKVKIAETLGIGIGKQHEMAKYWQEVLQGKISAASDIYKSSTTETVDIHFASSVKDENGEVFGIVVARMPVVKLYDITKEAAGIHGEEEVLEIDLVNKEGLLLYSNYNRRGILKANLSDYESFKRAVAGERIGSMIHYDPILEENDLFVFVREQGYLDFEGNDWILLLHIPTKIIFAPAVQLRNRTIAILSVIIVLTVVISLIFARTISRPLINLKNAAVEIGKGKLDTRIEAVSKDEIGELAASFNEMAFDLNKVTASRDALDHEVTERKQAEEALRESEEKYRSVVENIGIGISVIGPEMEILAMNRQMKQWFPDVDVSKRPLCYKAYNKPPRGDICSYCPTYKSLKDGQVHESITETPAGDKIVNYRIVSSPIKDKDGKVIAAIEMVEEITERKKAEEALRESEGRYKALFESTAEGIIVADTETKEFKYANPAVCRMLGYTEEELKRLSVRDIHPEEDLEYVISEFESQARGEKTLSPGIPCLRKDRTIVYADINTAKVLIDGRECNVGFFTDITERRKTEEALQKARDELEIRVEQRTRDLAKVNEELRKEINERKKAEEKLLIYQKQLRSLASELSLSEERLRRRIATDIHDHISQNLATSKIKLELLAQSISSPELGKSLNDIVELIARIIESTRSLTFELSPPVLYELGFEAAMEWLVRKMREQHGLSTEFRGDGQIKPLDNNVRVLLFQAVRELLVNVAKHAQAHNVTVSTQMAGDEMRVDVEDDGVGFDVSRAGSHDYKTGGFGLFSIRERLGHIGGHLNVESKRGVGTRVTLVAPIGHKEENR